MNIEQCKQAMNLMLDELNVKKVEIRLGMTEKGKAGIIFDGDTFSKYVGEEITPASDTLATTVVTNYLNKNG